MADDKANKKKYILLVLRISVVIAGLAVLAAWVFREGIWPDLKSAFARMDWWIFGCVFVAFCFSQFVVALRWWLLLRTQSVNISLWMANRLYLLGWFYNNVMPGSVGGDLVRLWYVTKHTERKFEAGLSVLVDRAIGLLSTLIIAFICYFLFLHSEKIPFVTKEGLLSGYWWLALLAVAAVLGGLSAHERGRKLLGRLWTQARGAFTRLISAGRLYSRKPLIILMVFGLTAAVQVGIITGFWVLGSNIGIEAGPQYYYVFFTLIWVIGMVPVSIAGAGVVEGGLVILFVGIAGVPKADAMAIALLQRFIWLLSSLPGAVIHLAGAHLPKDFSVDGGDSPA